MKSRKQPEYESLQFAEGQPLLFNPITLEVNTNIVAKRTPNITYMVCKSPFDLLPKLGMCKSTAFATLAL